MLIEKSPFYNTKKINNSATTEINKTSKNNINESIDSTSSEGSSFWSWFKGLVNPLQNLPLISGIYSSVNSEDESSDRDMVQNSLGGFLYGGPIGAIAGFGNWVFNKLFDKTPTEFALDLAGISKIWKGKKNDDVEVANENKKTLDGVSPLLASRNIILQESKINISSNKFKKEISQERILSFDKNTDKISTAKATISNLKTNQKINIKENIEKDVLTAKNKEVNDMNLKQSDFSKSKSDALSNFNEYKKIEFNYPTWKPSDNNLELKKDLIQSKYKNYYLDKINNKPELKIDA